jgi:hypothetical protein
VTIKRMLGNRRISAIGALGAIVFAWALASERPLPSDELVNRPDRPIQCGRTVAACEHRM